METKIKTYEKVLTIYEKLKILEKSFKNKRLFYNHKLKTFTDVFSDTIYTKIKINIDDFLEIKNQKFFVYEIYKDFVRHTKSDYNGRFDCLDVTSFLIYYPQKQICYVYKRFLPGYTLWNGNSSHLLTDTFYLQQILHNIDKEKVDDAYLNIPKSIKYWELLETSPKKVSSILNPDLKANNHIQVPSKKKDSNRFHSYQIVHFEDMVELEKLYVISMVISRVSKNKICPDIKKIIFSYL